MSGHSDGSETLPTLEYFGIVGTRNMFLMHFLYEPSQILGAPNRFSISRYRYGNPKQHIGPKEVISSQAAPILTAAVDIATIG